MRFIRFRCENIENKAQTYELLVFLAIPKSPTLYCCKNPKSRISFLGAQACTAQQRLITIFDCRSCPECIATHLFP